MTMLTSFNACERTKDDFIRVFKEADERFVFQANRTPEGSVLSFVEFIWKE